MVCTSNLVLFHLLWSGIFYIMKKDDNDSGIGYLMS